MQILNTHLLKEIADDATPYHFFFCHALKSDFKRPLIGPPLCDFAVHVLSRSCH